MDPEGGGVSQHNVGEESLGSTTLEAMYWAQQDSPSSVLCGLLLVPFIFLPVSDVRNPVQSNVKTPDSSELK